MADCNGYVSQGYVAEGYITCAACERYVSQGYIADGYADSCSSCERYVAEGYVANGYADNCSSCERYVAEGYVANGYADTCNNEEENNTWIRAVILAKTKPEFYIRESRIVITKALAKVVVETSLEQYLNTIIQAKVIVEANAYKLIRPRIIARAKAIVLANPNASYDLVSTLYIKANVQAKAYDLSQENIINIIDDLKKCCNSLEARLTRIERDYLIAQDIEPLFSGREVHYDV